MVDSPSFRGNIYTARGNIKRHVMCAGECESRNTPRVCTACIHDDDERCVVVQGNDGLIDTGSDDGDGLIGPSDAGRPGCSSGRDTDCIPRDGDVANQEGLVPEQAALA